MIEFFSFSAPGGHAENEDAYEVRVHPADLACHLFAIADGQGGQSGGGPAARLACKTCLDLATTFPAKQLLSPSTWMSIFGDADCAVSTDPECGLTTLAGFCIYGNWICGASCGDSAVFSCDQVNAGEILTARQSKNPPICTDSVKIVQFGALLPSCWRVAGMTDGVWKYVGWEESRRILKKEPCEGVIEKLLANARSPRTGRLQDDFTIIVIRGD